MCRRLPGHANKLQYQYAGPYRVAEVLSSGRYRVTDTENRMVKDEMHVSNLRPYRTVVDAVPLTADEYVVDSILTRRGGASSTQFLVKWRGYSRKETTWEPRGELVRRCADLVEAFEKEHPQPRPPGRPPRRVAELAAADAAVRKANEPERERDPPPVVDVARRTLRDGISRRVRWLPGDVKDYSDPRQNQTLRDPPPVVDAAGRTLRPRGRRRADGPA